MSASQGTWREPYFADADGREWHVYDTAKVKRKRNDMGLVSPDATNEAKTSAAWAGTFQPVRRARR
jgi:hypothetical protein